MFINDVNMFWIGFNSVFYLLAHSLTGLLVFIVLIVSVIILGLLYDKIRKILQRKLSQENLQKGVLYKKNVLVTGGSSGIGKWVAIEAARLGANVAIIARDQKKLEAAKAEIEKARRNEEEQSVVYVPLDVAKSSYADIEKVFASLELKMGPAYMLVNCAGTAICGRIEDTSEDALKHMLDLNFLGSYKCTKALMPTFKEKKDGRIVLVSSQGALLGIFGMSAYCSTKFALRGLAESLAMELMPYNVSVTLSLPPDTDTPGFEEEMKSKPLETKLISESAGLVQPEVVAKQLMSDALDGKFFSFVGLESFILTTLCSGMSPYCSFSELMTQALLMGPLRLVSAFFLYSFDNIIMRCTKEREKQLKSQ